jgi:hypothetical protein
MDLLECCIIKKEFHLLAKRAKMPLLWFSSVQIQVVGIHSKYCADISCSLSFGLVLELYATRHAKYISIYINNEQEIMHFVICISECLD